MSAPRSVIPGRRPVALAASSPSSRPSSEAGGSPPGRPACAGLDPHIVFARRAKDAAPALRACTRCTLHRVCEEAVAPADSWFDGVCAGRLWRNGHVIAGPVGRAEPAEPAAATARPATAAGGGQAARGGAAAPTRHTEPGPAPTRHTNLGPAPTRHTEPGPAPTHDGAAATAFSLGNRRGAARGSAASTAGRIGGGRRSA